ncbi:MAG: S41 family peptidase [bacterium]
MTKRMFSIWTVVAVGIFCVIGGMQLNNLISGDALFDQLTKLEQVYRLVKEYYVEPVDMTLLTESSINGMLDKLDPHSTYIQPKAFQVVSEEMKGKFEGIGIYFSIFNDTLVVTEPIGGGPSAQVGIQTNDRIVRINDSSVIGYTTVRIQASLKGPKGSKVKVSVVRSNVKELLDFVITRDVISLNSVDAAMMVREGVGYISVNKFIEPTHTEMATALKKLQGLGMKRLILDLRANPGGYLEEAVRMADLFLDGGSSEVPHKIVYTKARIPEFEESYVARTGEEFEKVPLIVLISNFSASASEIVAGAVQDWDRGLIVGETSFGKGLVQRQWELNDRSALRLTIARYYTPSGRLIQRAYEGKGKDEYRKEAFQREEQEGENIQHKTEGDSARPIFKTASGRIVYGGGGITPDYVVKSQTLTSYSQTILRRALTDQFIITYLDKEGSKIHSAYGKDFGRFKKDFVVDQSLMKDFFQYVDSKLAEDKDLKVERKDLDKDQEYLRVRLKATIARSYWGFEGWYSIMLEVDSQFLKAVTLFPEAMKIAKLN